MKKALSVVVIGLFVVMQTQAAMALTVASTFAMSATLTAATGLTITAKSWTLDGSGNPVLGTTVTSFPFGTLGYNSTLGIYTPTSSLYYAINATTTGGVGNPSVTVSYVEGNNPNPAGSGLGSKTAVTFVKAVWTGATTPPTETVISKFACKNLPQTILPAAVSGGWLNTYVGVVTDTSVAGSAPFTSSDVPGTYQGTLTYSATI